MKSGSERDHAKYLLLVVFYLYGYTMVAPYAF